MGCELIGHGASGVRVRIVAALVAILISATGCSAGTGLVEPALAPAEPRKFPVTVLGTVMLADAVARELGELRSRCLAAQGFPQAQQALLLRREPVADFVSSPLAVQPLDYGPATVAHARTYGMAGTEVALDRGDVGVLISRDPEFDRESQGCDRWIYQELAPGLQQLQSQVAQFRDEVDAAFVGGVRARLDAAAAQRIRCTQAAGHPRFTVERVNAGESALDVLRSAGVQAGGQGPPPPPEPDRRLVPNGEVRVFPPGPRPSYRPSADEVDLALAYVACGRSTGFFDRLSAASAELRGQVEQTWAGRAVTLHAALTLAHAHLHR